MVRDYDKHAETTDVMISLQSLIDDIKTEPTESTVAFAFYRPFVVLVRAKEAKLRAEKLVSLDGMDTDKKADERIGPAMKSGVWVRQVRDQVEKFKSWVLNCFFSNLFRNRGTQSIGR